MIQMIPMEYDHWREVGSCFGNEEVDFFSSTEAEAEDAVAMCSTCPVIEDCLDFALETNQPDGIWGGLTTPERTSLRRRILKDLRRAG